MKTKLFFIVSLFLTISFTNLQAQNVNIPDANLKNALLQHGDSITGENITVIDANGDGEIQKSEAESYTGTIKVVQENITDLTGIEAFINIKRLECTGNKLTNIDISNNTLLEAFYCDYNKTITTLDVSKNTELLYLVMDFNKVETLDLSKNSKLVTLSASGNKLSGFLDLSNNANLTYLYVNGNNLDEIDISGTKKLQYFYCDYNSIENLDLSEKPNLVALYCQNTQLQSLDLSSNPILFYLECDNTPISSLNVANGNNQKILEMSADNTPNLTCIQHDEGFNPEDHPYDPNTYTGWLKSELANWSTDCSISVDEIDLNNVQVYPNPAKNHININVEHSNLKDITIYDENGSKILQSSKANIDIKYLPQGIYFIKIQTKNGLHKTLKFVK